MQITKTSTQNFNGTFRIKPQETQAKIEIPKLFTQGRQVFHNILENGDEVIVIRNNYDKRIGKYIQEHNLKNIEYYPEISTKAGLDDQKPEDLIKLINDKTTKVITGIEEMLMVISKQKKAAKPPKSKKEVEKISNTLRLNIENPKITSTAELTRIRDDSKQRTIEVIMANKGNSYVFVKPDSLNQSSTRVIIDGQGHIMKSFETPDEIKAFMRQFQKLKREKVNLLVD